VAGIVPPLAMLIGAGVGSARQHHDRVRTSMAVGVAVTASGLASWMIARRVDWTLAARSTVFTVMAGVFLTTFVLSTRTRPHRLVTLAVLGSVLLAPFVWTVGSLKAGLSANLPYANPVAALDGFGGGPPGGAGGPGGPSMQEATLQYLREERGDADWLVATPSAMTAGQIIIDTGEPVMALGGFSGNDRILDVAGFDALVREGRIRFVLLGGGLGGGPGGRPGGGPGGGPGGASQLSSHITDVCTQVVVVADSLYDCAT